MAPARGAPSHAGALQLGARGGFHGRGPREAPSTGETTAVLLVPPYPAALLDALAAFAGSSNGTEYATSASTTC